MPKRFPSITLLFLIVLSTRVFAAETEKPQSVYPSGPIKALSKESVTVTDRKGVDQVFEIREDTTYESNYDLKIEEIQSGDFLQIAGKPNADKTVLNATRLTRYVKRDSSTPGQIAHWGGNGNALVQNNKLYFEANNCPVEILINEETTLGTSADLEFKDVKVGMRARISGKVLGDKQWASKIVILERVEKTDKQPETESAPAESEAPVAPAEEAPKPPIESLDFELKPVNPGVN